MVSRSLKKVRETYTLDGGREAISGGQRNAEMGTREGQPSNPAGEWACRIGEGSSGTEA